MPVDSSISRYYDVSVYMRGTFESVPSMSSQQFEIILDSDMHGFFQEGIVEFLGIECDSSNFDISLLDAFGVNPGEVGEFLRIEEISLGGNSQNLGAWFQNQDDPKENKIYCIIGNEDPVNNTGTIYWALGLKTHRKRIKP